MRRKSRPGGGRQAEIVIESLGGRGDGLGQLDGRPVFVALALPGDRIRVRLTGQRAGGFKAEAIEWLDAAPGRVEPPCRHYGPCGGCAVQHLEAARYQSWKRDLVVQALARRGLTDDVVQPLIVIPPGTRRRATLAAIRLGSKVHLGFHERESHRVVEVSDCLLLTPRLMALLPELRQTLAKVLGDRETADLAMTETETGIDVLVVTQSELNLDKRQALAELEQAVDLARLCWARPGEESEPVMAKRPPRVTFAGVAVEPPPGGFLQPSLEGEAALTGLVSGYLPKSTQRILELFAGCGSFSFALAARARLHAVEGDEAALAALWTGARRAGLTGRISIEARDLERRPLVAADLARFDTVVFDPPRAGAREQAQQIAESPLSAAIAVSCSPNSFARDARILVDGGFTLTEVTPVDQFPWSGHVELVASFRR